MLLRHAMYVNEKVNQCQPKHVYSCVQHMELCMGMSVQTVVQT